MLIQGTSISTIYPLTLNIEFSRTLGHAESVLETAGDQARILWESLLDCQCRGSLGSLDL